jgi:hypothetical protein
MDCRRVIVEGAASVAGSIGARLRTTRRRRLADAYRGLGDIAHRRRILGGGRGVHTRGR